MNEEQRKFTDLSTRKQLREVVTHVNALQLHLVRHGSELAHDPLTDPSIHGILQEIDHKLDWMADTGHFPGRLPRWKDAYDTIVKMFHSKTARKAILAATNNLWHDMAERAEISVREENFIVRTDDRTTPAGPAFPCDIVLDNIRSAFNTGSIIRSADGFGVHGVFLTGITADTNNPKVQKTAMGAITGVSIQRHTSLHTLIREKKAAGSTIYALETVEGSGNLMCEKFSYPMCLLLGNEEYGIPEDYLSAADRIIHIPMYGLKNSFNVGVSCAIVLYAARQQWDLDKTSLQ